ncbi:Methyl-accepting chemotaxis protein [Paramagnetospirillum magnetotacticum MS-1]|uniref:Methyl-accepting chemotaxis protein n=1 Tax=Paramagnetospirillum magnetotacticum MS-1 TaxID=272627 RepID=A0A0C2UB12_PARME|nr:methyl-accepting chemotaxis protein [Paramagnetospirillum magnetotacticum]KIL98672.1 Methyl-accepting chemotaxis protein [Paramagnetospirillum magnetotacticum MS-1]
MFARIADARITVKFFIAPLLLVVCIMVLGGVFHAAMEKQERSMEDMVTVSFANSRTAAELDGMAATIESNIYRLLGWQAAREEKERIDTLDTQVRADLKTLGEKSKILLETLKSDAAATKQIRDYVLAAGDVLDMYRSDHVTALAMMGATELEYDGIRAKLREMTGKAAAAADQDYREAKTAAGATRTQYFLVLAVFLALGAVVTMGMARLTARPVTQLTGVMGRLAEGSTDVEIPSQTGRDEVGEMARAVAVFRDGMKRAAELESQQRRQREQQTDLLARRDRLIADFNGAMEKIMGTVSASIERVHTLSSSLQSTAEQTSAQGSAVAGAAEHSAANVATVASAAEQLGSSVQEISRRVSETATITSEAVSGIHTANSTMDGLAEAAKRIGEVVQLINDIAGQTNLLALNATIEAARAGEAGKGFAVVASEVKTLANQTARATDEIAQQIAGIQSISAEAVNTIRNVGVTIDRVNEVVSSIAAAVEEQSAATDEIVRSVQEASSGNAEITRNIADVSKAAIATGQMAAGMFEAADELVEEAGHLRSEVGGFLGNMRQG